MALFEDHCRDSVACLFARGGYVPGNRFAVRPGPGYGDMAWAVFYGDRSWTNSGLRTRDMAERYADGYDAALDEAITTRVLALPADDRLALPGGDVAA